MKEVKNEKGFKREKKKKVFNFKLSRKNKQVFCYYNCSDKKYKGCGLTSGVRTNMQAVSSCKQSEPICKQYRHASGQNQYASGIVMRAVLSCKRVRMNMQTVNVHVLKATSPRCLLFERLSQE